MPHILHLSHYFFILIIKLLHGWKIKIIEEKDLYMLHVCILIFVHRTNFHKHREDIEVKRKEALLEKERERSRRKETEIKEKEELTKKNQSCRTLDN